MEANSWVLPSQLAKSRRNNNLEGPSDFEHTLGRAKKIEVAPNSDKASTNSVIQHIGQKD